MSRATGLRVVLCSIWLGMCGVAVAASPVKEKRSPAQSDLSRWSEIALEFSHPCKAALLSTVQSWGILDQWQEIQSMNPREQAFKTPTSTTGVWSEIFVSDAPAPIQAYRTSRKEMIQVTFKINECKPLVSIIPVDRPETTGSFRDSDLEDLLKKNQQGLIYVWSPRFPYSAAALKDFAAAAKAEKVPLTVLVDSAASVEAVRTMASENGISVAQTRWNESHELEQRGSQMHQPWSVYYRGGAIVGAPTRGVRPQSVFRQWIQERKVGAL